MNPKTQTIIIAIAACLGFSLASFFIGFNIGRNSTGESSSTNTNSKTKDPDSKYIGIYLSTTYNNGNQVTSELYLNEGHDCTNPHGERQKYSSCTWSVEDNKIIVTIMGGGALGETIEQCNQIQQENYSGKESKIIIFDEEDKAEHSNSACMVQTPYVNEYDILNDGSLYDGSYRGETYYKRG